MKTNTSFLFFSYSILLLTTLSHGFTRADSDRKLHIVYMGALPREQISTTSLHTTMLQQVVGTSSLEKILARSYTRSFNGFAAYITEKERQQLSSMEGVVSVFPSTTLQLHTTRSWDFIGLNELTDRRKTEESNTIIGMLDSGIWPEAESFKDEGFGPPPKKWKGICLGGDVRCNNKIIGARAYDLLSPIKNISARDQEGHGTHTASTAAGNPVKDVSYDGLGSGTIKGGVPSARIAVYKVCGWLGCGSAEVLAAFDDAIADGVDIISISMGPKNASRLEEDPISIGAFHAMEKGVLTAQSAGNSGPKFGTALSTAPWLLSVAASTTDRLFIDRVILGNEKSVKGFAINTASTGETKLPLVYDEDVTKSNCGKQFNNLTCDFKCLDVNKVAGKILLCQDHSRWHQAVGIIRRHELVRSIQPEHLPAVDVDVGEFDEIYAYLKSTKNPTAQILKSEAIKDPTAPVVANFSSRGPNIIVPQILKPDISAPGVAILAAISPTTDEKEGRKYDIYSGTSMSCPHAAGAAAYVKTFHPDWSPSVIKSTIMTTAWTMDPKTNKGEALNHGSGHINPVKAIDPGLVYETEKSDYVKMLCGEGMGEKLIRKITGDNTTCPKDSDKAHWKDLNYPSMAANVTAKKQFEVTFNRTVTNVGLPNSIYKAKVSETKNLSIKVEPDVLSFKSLSEKKSFVVTVSGYLDGLFVTSSLIWSDGKHIVRSPIVVYVENIQ